MKLTEAEDIKKWQEYTESEVKSLSHVWLCNPMDCSPPGSSVHGIFQERVLEYVAITFSGDLPYPEIEPRYPAL